MKFEKAMGRLGERIMRHPRPILAGTIAAALLAGWAVSGLRVNTEIADMLPENNPAARSYTEITDSFSTTSSLIAVVQGPDRETLARSADTFAARLRSDPRTAEWVGAVQYKVDRDFAARWGLMLQDVDELAETDRVLASSRLVPLLRATNDLLEEKLADGSDEEVEGAEGEDGAYAMMSRFGLFASELRETIEGTAAGGAEALSDAWLFGEEYFLDPAGKTLLMTVRPTFDLGERASLTALSEGAAAIARELEKETPGTSFSFTGDVANEADEERAIGSDLFYPTAIAMTLILALFLFSFRRKRSIFFALAALAVGVLVDLGFAAVSIRELNMITSSFGALLVGLGIDFGIHIVSRFDSVAKNGRDPASAMGEVFEAVGSPVLVGGLTTALAFYSLLFSRTLAFRQFGLIAGTGILTTLAASFIVLPALLAAFPGKRPDSGRRPVLSFALPANVITTVSRRKIPAVAIGAAAAALAVLNIPNNGFEYDMRKIGPQGTEAQAAEREVAERFGVSTWRHMTSARGLEEARELQARFEEVPLVRRAESAADYVPSAGEQWRRMAAMAPLAARTGRTEGADWDASMVKDLLYEIQRLEWNVIELGDLAAVALGEKSLPTRKRDAMIREVLGAETGAKGQEVFRKLMDAVEALPPDRAVDILSRVDTGFSAALDAKVKTMASVNRLLTPDDLPADVRSEYVSPDGSRYLVIVQGDPGSSDSGAIERFSEGLTAVDPGATGSLTLGVELSREILSEAKSSAVVVAIIVFAIVGIGFRSMALSAMTGAALMAAIVWMFGLQPFFGKFNIVNALALPLIIGVGIDYCVHIVSALREPGDANVALERSCKAVTLSMLTTAIGFGSLALAGRFAGIAALGETLFIGIVCCYVAAVALAPVCVPAADRPSAGSSRIPGETYDEKERRIV